MIVCVVCKRQLWYWIWRKLIPFSGKWSESFKGSFALGFDPVCRKCFNSESFRSRGSSIHLHDRSNRVVIGKDQDSGQFANKDWAAGRAPKDFL